MILANGRPFGSNDVLDLNQPAATRSMNRQLGPMILIALIVGCSGPDPADSPLKAGQTVVVAVSPCNFDPDATNRTVTEIGAGVRLTVGVDDGLYVEDETTTFIRIRDAAPAEAEAIRKAGPIRAKVGEPLSELRQVKVTVQDGPLAGESGSVRRMDVRVIER